MTLLTRALRVAYGGCALIALATLATISTVIVMFVGALKEDDYIIGVCLPPTCIFSGFSAVFIGGTMGLCRSHADNYERRQQVVSRGLDYDPKIVVTKWLSIFGKTFRWTWVIIASSDVAFCKYLPHTSVNKDLVRVAPYFGISMYVTALIAWFFTRSIVNSIKIAAGHGNNQRYDD